MLRLLAAIARLCLVGFACSGCQPEPAPQSASTSIVAAADSASHLTQAAPRVSAIAQEFAPLSVDRRRAEPASNVSPFFTNVARAAGINQVYITGSNGQLLMVEAVGGGCGWIDFDRDGHCDLYLNQGGDPVATDMTSQPADQLFRNLGDGQFANVTNSTGIDERGYSQGIAVGDFDNDGFDDLFVTNVGADVLYQNQGDGTFVDVTASTIGHDLRWGTSAAWGDLDRDGDLDLYVCNYVDFDPYHPLDCQNSKGLKIMCQPNQVEPVADECFLNMGDGTFRPVARERGLFGAGNRAMGVAIADFNNDGWPDVFVANDATPNFLFVNRHDGTFVDEAPLLGCAVSSDGRSQANMGIALGDYDRNGWLDIYLTHFEGEWNTLYRNNGPSGFQDVSAIMGLVPPKLSMVGFGTVMHDFNQDGQDELIVINGHLDDPGHLGVELEMPPQCFTFNGSRWHECSDAAGKYFRGRYVGRGLAMADFDNDGDVDLAVVHQNLPAALLRNDSERGHWLKLQFVGRRSNRDAVGVRATVHHGPTELLQELAGGTSYCAAHQPILIFGLGQSAARCRVDITWPSGAIQTLENVVVDQTLSLLEPLGEGEPPKAGGPPAENGHE